MVLVYPAPILRKISEPIKKFDQNLSNLIKDMIETMNKFDGIGLAAPQIGVSQQVIVFKTIGEEVPHIRHLINPKILEKSGKVIIEEGCLSVPKVLVDVKRAQKIIVKGQNKNGDEVVYETDKFWAVIVQHEIDHLNGKLIIDYLSPIKKALVLSHYKKRSKKP